MKKITSSKKSSATRVATKNDINLVKKDLKNEIDLVKEDIKSVKKDLKNEIDLVRKDFKNELKKYATKQDLDDMATSLYSSFYQDLNSFRQEVKQDINKIMNILDFLVKTIEDIKADNAAALALYGRMEDGHANHETRIIKIEHHLQLAQ